MGTRTVATRPSSRYVAIPLTQIRKGMNVWNQGKVRFIKWAENKGNRTSGGKRKHAVYLTFEREDFSQHTLKYDADEPILIDKGE